MDPEQKTGNHSSYSLQFQITYHGHIFSVYGNFGNLKCPIDFITFELYELGFSS